MLRLPELLSKVWQGAFCWIFKLEAYWRCAGANTWPGANILQLQDGSKFVLRAGALRRAADELRIGDIVQVHENVGSVPYIAH